MTLYKIKDIRSKTFEQWGKEGTYGLARYADMTYTGFFRDDMFYFESGSDYYQIPITELQNYKLEEK